MNRLDIISTYRFLDEIPGNVLEQIDLSNLYLPNSHERDLLDQLASQLDKNVVVYRRFAEPKKLGLCQAIAPAKLTPDELEMVKELEANLNTTYLNDKVVVIYGSPPQLTRTSEKRVEGGSDHNEATKTRPDF